MKDDTKVGQQVDPDSNYISEQNALDERTIFLGSEIHA